MSGALSNPSEPRDLAERAYVAIRYVLGARQSQLISGLFEPGPAARKLARALGHHDRLERAQILALDLRPIVGALDDMRVS